MDVWVFDLGWLSIQASGNITAAEERPPTAREATGLVTAACATVLSAAGMLKKSEPDMLRAPTPLEEFLSISRIL